MWSTFVEYAFGKRELEQGLARHGHHIETISSTQPFSKAKFTERRIT